MINLNRRRRQASEDSNIVIERFVECIRRKECLYPVSCCIKNEFELMKIVDDLVRSVKEKAKSIQTDWSIPIIVEAIAKLYYGEQKNYIGYGTTFKRSLVYLWYAQDNRDANHKNIGSLIEVLKLSYVLEILYGLRKFFLISEEFQVELNNGYCSWNEEHTPMIEEFSLLVQGRGKRMRVSSINSTLMLDRPIEFYSALLSVIEGELPHKIELFQGTFYEHIPGIADKECKRFWQCLFLRYVLFFASLFDGFYLKGYEIDIDTKVTLFHEFGIELPEGYFTQEMVKEVFWNRDWVDAQDDERYSHLIVERPILRISPYGDFATCPILIGDSINDFLEGQIFDYSFRTPKINLPKGVFKNAFSEPFENLIIEILREAGFETGHVSEAGVWKTQRGDIVLDAGDGIDLFGEVDALAYSEELNLAILAECKVLNDVRDYRSYKNIVAKLVDDSEGFQYKLSEKNTWVNRALSKKYNTNVNAICAILTDIPLPVINFHNEDIFCMDYARFFAMLTEWFKELLEE